MNRLRSSLLLALVVAGIVAGFGWVFSLRLASGDVYPYYSSHRADALGTRVLHDALAGVPDLTVERDYHVLSRLQPRDRTIFITGVSREEWNTLNVAELRALNAAMQNGARVVIAFHAVAQLDSPKAEPKANKPDKPAAEPGTTPEAKTPPVGPEVEKEKKPDTPAKKKKKRPANREEADLEEKNLAKEWGVGFKQRWLFSNTPAAERDRLAPAELPASVEWHSDLYFVLPPETPWRVIYRRAAEPVLVEKPVGRGSIVLAADAFFLSNEAMQRARATGLVTWLVGAHREIAFHEGVLGVLEENGLGALARRYGLGGAVALTALLAALYAWRRVVAFVPLPDEERATGEVVLQHDPAAGLTSLLGRALRGPALLATCVAEWRKSRRSPTPAEARLAAAWQATPPDARRADTYNALVDSLKAR